jgi:hypothetical protein
MTAECSGQFYRIKLRGIEPALIQVYKRFRLPAYGGETTLTPMPGAGTTKDENEVVAIKDESR